MQHSPKLRRKSAASRIMRFRFLPQSSALTRRNCFAELKSINKREAAKFYFLVPGAHVLLPRPSLDRRDKNGGPLAALASLRTSSLGTNGGMNCAKRPRTASAFISSAPPKPANFPSAGRNIGSILWTWLSRVSPIRMTISSRSGDSDGRTFKSRPFLRRS